MTRSVGKIIDGDQVYIVFDDGVAPLHADLVTEIAEKDGVVRLSFAAITQDGDGVPKAEVVARLRMTRDVAWSLCRSIKAVDGTAEIFTERRR
ncbi:hypothetical protein ACFHWW_04885 [Ensifer sp. P24N7]|uniref:hypothetical protein n=1 Tax=Sinorhizobium sp. P24N7 TaxID=3348358 RepID=UPI0035F4E639